MAFPSGYPQSCQVKLKSGAIMTLTNIMGPPIQVDVPTVRLGSTNSNTTVNMPLTDGVAIGMRIRGSGILPNTFVTAIVTNTSVTISQAATATAANIMLFIGDGYNDASTYRDDMNVTDIGETGVASVTYFDQNDKFTHEVPRNEAKVRTQTQWPIADASGNPAGFKWAWSDQIEGNADSVSY